MTLRDQPLCDMFRLATQYLLLSFCPLCVHAPLKLIRQIRARCRSSHDLANWKLRHIR